MRKCPSTARAYNATKGVLSHRKRAAANLRFGWFSRRGVRDAYKDRSLARRNNRGEDERHCEGVRRSGMDHHTCTQGHERTILVAIGQSMFARATGHFLRRRSNRGVSHLPGDRRRGQSHDWPRDRREHETHERQERKNPACALTNHGTDVSQPVFRFHIGRIVASLRAHTRRK